MIMIIGVAAGALLALFDIKKILKIDEAAGRKKTLAVYSALMLAAVVVFCLFTWLDDFSLAKIVMPNY